MDKIKIHELAKKIGKSSKEIMEVASKIGIEIKSHLSLIEQNDANKIEKEINKMKSDNKSQEKQTIQKSNSTPVIIRREVIISEEETQKKEALAKTKSDNATRKDVGFVERKKNQEYNIVYRNKPTKPMTASELFGFASKPKKEEPKKEEVKKEEIVESKKEEPKEIPEKKDFKKPADNQKFGNKPKFDNNHQRNFGDNKSVNKFNRNDRNDRDNRTGSGNRYPNKRSFGGENNAKGDYRNNKKLDDRGIEKNIKNIINTNVNMNISIFYEKKDKYKTIRELTYHIGNVGVELKEGNQNKQDIDIAAFSYNDARYIRREMQVNGEEIYYMYIYLTVFSNDKRELEYLINKVEGISQSKGIRNKKSIF